MKNGIKINKESFMKILNWNFKELERTKNIVAL
jgi:hypothetical protein